MLTAQVAGVGRTSCAHHLSENLFVRHIRNKHASQQRANLQHAREHTSFSRTRYHVRHVSAAAADAPVVTKEADEGKRGLSSMPEQELHHTVFQAGRRQHAALRADSEAILLEVSGMKCGGCSSAVKRILLGNPEIQSAAVNLLTESAVFKIPAKSDKAALAEQAANLLTKQVTHVGIMLPVACSLLRACPLIRPSHTCHKECFAGLSF